ncbi:MAG: lasso peptide biosynthesis protein [Flavobacterium sp.]|nr:lasso peptide biosynthesis protein [Flavobacterium sp.]
MKNRTTANSGYNKLRHYVQNCTINFHNFVLGHRKNSAPKLPQLLVAAGRCEQFIQTEIQNMTQNMKQNLNTAISGIQNEKNINGIFSNVLDIMINADWKGACHESCAALHILLNEFGISNVWLVGEAKVNEGFFDHSWIEIDSNVYDIAIFKPLKEILKNGPVINGIDIITNQPTTTQYGVKSGLPDHAMTEVFKSFTNLGEYLLGSPMHPTLGTWKMIDYVAQKLGKKLDISTLIKKYNSQYYTVV